MDKQVLESIVSRHRDGERYVVATLVRVRGSAPQYPGARLLVAADGSLVGTIGGGCLEMEARRRALDLMGEDRAVRFELRLDDDFGWDDGLICGGQATVLLDADIHRQARIAEEILAHLGAESIGKGILTDTAGSDVGRQRIVDLDGRYEQATWDSAAETLTEPIQPDPVLIVCGCGHVGGALIKICTRLGFRTVAVDDRPDFASAERFPGVSSVLCEDPARVAREWPTDRRTFWVVVTRGHRNDGRVLAGIVERPSAYVGMIGSNRKIRMVREGLLASGVSPGAIDRVHTPIGLDIGARTPEEIALSIAAELVAVRRKGSASHLRPG